MPKNTKERDGDRDSVKYSRVKRHRFRAGKINAVEMGFLCVLMKRQHNHKLMHSRDFVHAASVVGNVTFETFQARVCGFY